MQIESARLAYVPFRYLPYGHVFIIFRTNSGNEVVISPEADLRARLLTPTLSAKRIFGSVNLTARSLCTQGTHRPAPRFPDLKNYFFDWGTRVSRRALSKNKTFSLVRGLRKSYLLQYVVTHSYSFLEQYTRSGRTVRMYPLDLSGEQLTGMYQRMLVRAKALEREVEWYHTFFNSCVTNTAQHIDTAISFERSYWGKVALIVMPRRIILTFAN